jgi:electron transfer flavoprotein alpha subunit
MRILVYVEARNGALSADALGVLTRAAHIGEADAVICGIGVRALAEEAAAHGAATVALADDVSVAEPLPQPHADVLEAVCRSTRYDAVFFATSILATDVAGGLAARLEAGVNWDLVDVDDRAGELVGLRLALGDSVLVETTWSTPLRIATFRPGSFEAQRAASASPQIRDVPVTVAASSRATRRTDAVGGRTGAASLADADVIVAGGRGLGAPENLQLVRDLADALGGVPAVSMPLVSEGWAPYAMQVGQTGTIVRPRLYIACGISGQMQHKIGMERSGTIVAINVDEAAPIARFCDLAVVADVHDVLPALTALVRARGHASVSG